MAKPTPKPPFQHTVWTQPPDIDAFNETVDEVLMEERLKRIKGIHTKHFFGAYYDWQHQQAYHLQDMPTNRRARFNAFVANQSVKPRNGIYHLHAFWNARDGQAYWKLVSRGSSKCKAPGCCFKIKMEVI